MRIIHQLCIEKALSQFLQISDQLTYIESIYDSSTLDEKKTLLSYAGASGHTLLMAAIVNQHPLANKLLDEINSFSDDEKVDVLLKVNNAGATLLTVAVLCEAVESVRKIISLIEQLPASRCAEILSQLLTVWAWNESIFFSNETGKVVFTNDKKFEKNSQVTGALNDVAARIGNVDIIEALYQAGLRMELNVGRLAEAQHKFSLKKLQEVEHLKRNESVEQEVMGFREITAANHRFFTTPVQGVVVKGPVLSRTVEGEVIGGYLPTAEQIRVIQSRR